MHNSLKIGIPGTVNGKRYCDVIENLVMPELHALDSNYLWYWRDYETYWHNKLFQENGNVGCHPIRLLFVGISEEPDLCKQIKNTRATRTKNFGQN